MMSELANQSNLVDLAGSLASGELELHGFIDSLEAVDLASPGLERSASLANAAATQCLLPMAAPTSLSIAVQVPPTPGPPAARSVRWAAGPRRRCSLAARTRPTPRRRLPRSRLLVRGCTAAEVAGAHGPSVAGSASSAPSGRSAAQGGVLHLRSGRRGELREGGGSVTATPAWRKRTSASAAWASPKPGRGAGPGPAQC